jgi:hypothetical protein
VTVLGEDLEQAAMDAFSGELHDATLTQQPAAAYDVNDPTAAPSSVPIEHECEGYAFTYQRRDIDGSRVLKNDYRVVLLRGSLSVMPGPGDTISIPPPGSDTPATARVVDIEAVTEAQITLQVRG